MSSCPAYSNTVMLRPISPRPPSPMMRSVSVPWLIAVALIAMGVLLWLVDSAARQKRTLDEMTAVDALLMGIAQVAALIPGVSRSGATLTAAMGLGFARPEAARLSFLLGIPAIAARWPQGDLGTAQGWAADPGLGHPVLRSRRLEPVRFFRDLGIDAFPRALLDLAADHLSRRVWVTTSPLWRGRNLRSKFRVRGLPLFKR